MSISLSKLLNEMGYEIDSPDRNYIGASSIGSDCLRQIWYEFKNGKGNKIPNKLRRTWEIGKLLEGMVIDLLHRCGVNISSLQNEFIHPNLHYFKGHCDGVLVDFNAILEIKTAKDASFKVFVNKGCKIWSKKYYAQVQSYMGMSGLKLACILVLNRDTSEFHEEWIAFDSFYFEQLTDKAIDIYRLQEPPRRIHNSPLWFECRMCRYNGICRE